MNQANQVTPTLETDLAVFDSLKAEITTLVSPISTLKVTDAATQLQAAEHGKKLRALKKAFDDKRDELTRPLFTEQRRINDQVGEYMKPLLGAITHLSAELAVFAKAELARKEQARLKAEQDAAAKRKQIEDEAAERQLALAEFGVGPSKAAEKATAQAVKAVEKELKAEVRQLSVPSVAGVRQPWRHEILDVAQIPREFMKPDEDAIKAFIAKGGRSLAGVRIFQDVTVSGESASRAAT